MMTKKELKSFRSYKKGYWIVLISLPFICMALSSMYVFYFHLMQKQYNHNLELERKERELLEKEIENLSFQISRSINEKKDTSEIPVDTYIYAPILSPLDFDELIPDIFLPLYISVSDLFITNRLIKQ